MAANDFVAAGSGNDVNPDNQAIFGPCAKRSLGHVGVTGRCGATPIASNPEFMATDNTRISQPILRAPGPQVAIGQLGGHVKRGVAHPKGLRTGAKMALISALPLHPASDKMVVTFMDRSDPNETFDYMPEKGDNLVLFVPRDEVFFSVIHGVNPGDCKGAKIILGDSIEEPEDLDVDPTGLDLAASDAWVDQVDELGCDCSKFGGYPLWANAPLDMDRLCGRPMRFHHRLTSDLVDFQLGDGGVVYVFVNEDETGGAVCWQQAHH